MLSSAPRFNPGSRFVNLQATRVPFLALYARVGAHRSIFSDLVYGGAQAPASYKAHITSRLNDARARLRAESGVTAAQLIEAMRSRKLREVAAAAQHIASAALRAG